MVARLITLDIDTQVFAIRCGRVELDPGPFEIDQLHDLMNVAQSQGVRHLTMRTPLEWSHVAKTLPSLGFRFILQSLSLDKRPSSQEHKVSNVYDYEQEDDARIREITRSAFSAGTRFHMEPLFSSSAVERLHDRWINRALRSSSVRVFVHRNDATITGYVALQGRGADQPGHIELIAVDPEYRRRGIGYALLRHMESVMAPSVERVSVMTEAANTGATGLYTRADFVRRQMWDVWHASFGR